MAKKFVANCFDKVLMMCNPIIGLKLFWCFEILGEPARWLSRLWINRFLNPRLPSSKTTRWQRVNDGL